MYFTCEEDMNSAGPEGRALEQIEALTPNVTIFEDQACKDVNKVKRGQKGGVLTQ